MEGWVHKASTEAGLSMHMHQKDAASPRPKIPLKNHRKLRVPDRNSQSGLKVSKVEQSQREGKGNSIDRDSMLPGVTFLTSHGYQVGSWTPSIQSQTFLALPPPIFNCEQPLNVYANFCSQLAPSVGRSRTLSWGDPLG